jgi:hypothetical protein
MTKLDLLNHLFLLRERAELDLSRASELKNPHLIASAIGRLNQIERDILNEESRRRLERIDRKSAADWNSPENRAIEAKRLAMIAVLESVTGKSLREIISSGNPSPQKKTA